MHLIIKAGREFIPRIVEILNSNAPLYQNIVSNPEQSDEMGVDIGWAEKNFNIRDFYILFDNTELDRVHSPSESSKDSKYPAFATYQNMGSFSYIGFLFVEFGKHKRGYGRSLLNFLEIRTIHEGLPEIRLFVHRKADWAQNFYQKMGYHVISDNKEEILAMDEGIMQPFYLDDHIYLGKHLKSSAH